MWVRRALPTVKTDILSIGNRISAAEGSSFHVSLPRGPVKSVTFVKVISSDWSETTINTNAYYLNAGKENLIFDAAPMGQIVQIQYVCGYGLPSDVPEPIRQGILTHVVGMYENRMENKGMPDAAINLYDRYRVIKL